MNVPAPEHEHSLVPAETVAAAVGGVAGVTQLFAPAPGSRATVSIAVDPARTVAEVGADAASAARSVLGADAEITVRVSRIAP